ncbi:MAG: hypothetical protein GKS00_24645 [Alphaproteobacteria bacterium]|nr:hypothetical protein [Alphaproteobacteria bacterium]
MFKFLATITVAGCLVLIMVNEDPIVDRVKEGVRGLWSETVTKVSDAAHEMTLKAAEPQARAASPKSGPKGRQEVPPLGAKKFPVRAPDTISRLGSASDKTPIKTDSRRDLAEMEPHLRQRREEILNPPAVNIADDSAVAQAAFHRKMARRLAAIAERAATGYRNSFIRN